MNEDGTCAAFLNHTLVKDSTPIYLVANINLRLKFEHQHTTYGDTFSLQHAGPFATHEVAAASSSSAHSVVPSVQLLHEVVCPDGCNGRGCCVADGRCQCESGYGGASCEVVLDSCGVDAPSGALVAGGLRARYFSDRSFDTLVTEQIDERVYLPSGELPPGVPRYG